MMRRREFIKLLGGTAAAWPLAARAQQPATPVIGFLDSESRRDSAASRGRVPSRLGQASFFEGRNVAIESPLGRETHTIDCRHWQPIWFAAGWP